MCVCVCGKYDKVFNNLKCFLSLTKKKNKLKLNLHVLIFEKKIKYI